MKGINQMTVAELSAEIDQVLAKPRDLWTVVDVNLLRGLRAAKKEISDAWIDEDELRINGGERS